MMVLGWARDDLPKHRLSQLYGAAGLGEVLGLQVSLGWEDWRADKRALNI